MLPQALVPVDRIMGIADATVAGLEDAVGIMGTLLRNRRAGETRLAWNMPGLAGAETLALTSPAFTDGAAIPVEHAAKRIGGRETSPPLAWTPAPDGTAVLLLVMEDADVPMGKPLVHSIALIAPSVAGLPAGALDPAAVPAGVTLLRPSFGRGYLGPAPIKGHGPHRYVFQLFALGRPAGDAAAAARANPRAVLAGITAPVLARGRLTGTYER
jgi:phosphatidylethanolamine-binding protein (PEBP) family uncharacterized protein